MRRLRDSIKKKYVRLYTNSKLFRNLANSLGIGLGSSFFYGMTGGSCPCCGKNAGTCAVGIGTIVVFGILFGVLSFIFLTLKESYEWIKGRLGW
jgi:hypothetical protein